MKLTDVYRSERESATSLLAKFGLQAGFYVRPFRVYDAEIDSVPDAAACGDHVIAEGSIFAGSDAQDRSPRALIERVGLQLHANALKCFEGMAQQQIFRFRVDGAALPLPRHPCPANLQAMMNAVNIAIAGR